MKGKEALNQLYILADTPEQAMVIQSYYNIVEKDLEVLEILKRLIDIDYKVDFYTNKIDAIPKKILVKGTLTKQELEKIQEWLNKK